MPVAKKGEPTTKKAPLKKRASVANKPEKAETDDALMTTTLRAMEWASKRRKQIAIAIGGAFLAAGLFGAFLLYRNNREEKASALIAKGVAAEFAPLRQGDEDPDIAKRILFYGSEDEKQKAALASYVEAQKQYGDTGPGILARLGEAGVHLDRHEWDEALTAYTDVRGSSLGQADADVRLRCIEGVGYAREGKGLLDDARRSFDELSMMDVKGAKPLGLYHLARLDLQKGDKDAALNKLKIAREAVVAPGAPQARFLKEQIEKLMVKLDPTSVPKPPPGGMPGGMNGLGGAPGGLPPDMSPEQLQQLIDSMKGQQGGAVPPQPLAPAPKGS